MPPKPGVARLSLEAKTAAVKRHLAGISYEVVAYECGVNPQTVRAWTDQYSRRVCAWAGDTTPRDDEPEFDSTAAHRFVTTIHRPPGPTREPIEQAWLALSPVEQGVFAPAMDAYLLAAAAADEARRLRTLASELAMREVGADGHARQEAA